MGQYLRVSEVAKKYAVNPATVRRWLVGGKVKAIKVGRQHRILETDLQAFLVSSASVAPPFYPDDDADLVTEAEATLDRIGHGEEKIWKLDEWSRHCDALDG